MKAGRHRIFNSNLKGFPPRQLDRVNECSGGVVIVRMTSAVSGWHHIGQLRGMCPRVDHAAEKGK